MSGDIDIGCMNIAMTLAVFTLLGEQRCREALWILTFTANALIGVETTDKDQKRDRAVETAAPPHNDHLLELIKDD